MHDQSPSWFVLRSKATADIHYDALIPTVVFTALASLLVVLRWCSRIYSRSGAVKSEDYLVTAAMASTYVRSHKLDLIIADVLYRLYGGGRRRQDAHSNSYRGREADRNIEFSINGEDLKRGGLESPLLSTMLKFVLAQTILYHLASNLVKASFLLQYTRLFLTVPSIIWICNILFALVFGAAAWGIFGNVFLCDPIQSYWDVSLSGTCMNKESHFWSTSIIGLSLDFAIWVLPIPVVGKLKLPKRQKISLVGVFGLGGFVCIVTLLRLVLVRNAVKHGQVTRAGTYAIIFSSVEVNTAIICASLLVMKPLFARFLPAIVSEQPVSAADDAVTCRALTGLHLLRGATADDLEKARGSERRDTLVEMNGLSPQIASAKETRRLKKGLANSKRNTM